MIPANARLRLERIPVASLQIKGEYEEPLSPDRMLFYYHKLMGNPGQYAGLCHVVPSNTHHNSFCILDGRHKFMASLLAGRSDVLAIVHEAGAGKGEYVHRLEHLLQSCIDFIGNPAIGGEHGEAYGTALCSEARTLLLGEEDVA